MKTVLNLRVVLLILAAMLTSALPALAEPPVWIERESLLMGTRMRVRVAAASREAGLAASEAVFAEVRRLEAMLSSWRDSSEIGRINSARLGRAVPVSDELWSMLQEAQLWSDRTGGAFHFAVGALIDAWDLRGRGRIPSDCQLSAALQASGSGAFRWASAGREVIRLDSAAWIDTGGFGKGAALRAAERVLQDAGVQAALLDFGGQLLAFGTPPEEGWDVSVAHPSRREEPAYRLRLTRGSVSTSSQSERFVSLDNERFGHVLDPRTGRPVAAWGSVTVVTEDAVVADILSTALLVMGPEAATRFMEDLEDIGVLLLEERGGEVLPRWNPALERYRARTD